MIMTDLFSLCLRIGELAFSATVAGLNGQYLNSQKNTPASSIKRFIYTEGSFSLLALPSNGI